MGSKPAALMAPCINWANMALETGVPFSKENNGTEGGRERVMSITLSQHTAQIFVPVQPITASKPCAAVLEDCTATTICGGTESTKRRCVGMRGGPDPGAKVYSDDLMHPK